MEIPADVVSAESDTVLARYQKLARIPGFRKGKVPASIVRQRFAEEIKSEIVEALVPRYFREETKKQNLLPVSQPRVTDLHLHEGEPLNFKASFEVLPDFKVAAYDDIQIEKLAHRSDRGRGRDRAQQSATSSTPPTAPWKKSVRWPTATLPWSASRARRRKASRMPTPSRSKWTRSWSRSAARTRFRSSARTCAAPRPGEQRSFEVKYADDFADKRLAGKTMTYEVDVKGIKTRSVPELNDEFAKELGAEFTTLDELRNRLRENMKAEKQHEAEHQGKDKIVEELVKRNDFPVPEAMLDQQIDLRLERGLRALAAQGMRTEDMKRMDFGRLRAGQREGCAARGEGIVDPGADCRRGEDRGQRRRARSRIGSAGDPVEADRSNRCARV